MYPLIQQFLLIVTILNFPILLLELLYQVILLPGQLINLALHLLDGIGIVLIDPLQLDHPIEAVLHHLHFLPVLDDLLLVLDGD